MPVPAPITNPAIGGTSLTTLAGQVTNATFVGRVAVAIGVVARLVLAEDPSYYNVTPSAGSGAGQDSARKRLATLVNSNPLAYAEQQFAYYVLADLVTTSSSSDDDIMARVVALWNDLSTPYLP